MKNISLFLFSIFIFSNFIAAMEHEIVQERNALRQKQAAFMQQPNDHKEQFINQIFENIESYVPAFCEWYQIEIPNKSTTEYEELLLTMRKQLSEYTKQVMD